MYQRASVCWLAVAVAMMVGTAAKAQGQPPPATAPAHGRIVAGAPANALFGAPWTFDAEHAKLVGAHVLGEVHFAGLGLDINASNVQSYTRLSPHVVIVVGHLASAKAPGDVGLAPGDAARASFEWLRGGMAAARTSGDDIVVREDRESSDEPGAWNLELSWENAASGVKTQLRAALVLTATSMAVTYGECFYGAAQDEAPDGNMTGAQACAQALGSIASPIAREQRKPFELTPRRNAPADATELSASLTTGQEGGPVQLVIEPRRTDRKPFYLVGGLILLAGVLWYIVGAVRKRKS